MAEYECFHPGIRNEYRTGGATEDEAWQAMAAVLEKHHGGLAGGMLSNCRVYKIIPDPDEPHAVAWVEGSSNTSTHPPLYGRTQKEAAERLHQTQQIWNGQYIQTASLSRAPGWVLEWADATAALVEAGGSEPDAEDIPRRQSSL